MVKVIRVRFDDATRSSLCAKLSPSKRGPAAPPRVLDSAIVLQLDASLAVSEKRNTAALRVAEVIASEFLTRRAQGWNDPPAPKEQTRRTLVRVRGYLDNLITNPDEPVSALTKLLTEVLPGGELEARLIRSGWPRGFRDVDDWEEWLPSRAQGLCPGVSAALKELQSEVRESGAPVQYAEREAFHGLATVWWWATGRPVSPWRDADGTRQFPFADFAQEVLNAANFAAGLKPSPTSGRLLSKLIADLV
jgi:hypothetical protein